MKLALTGPVGSGKTTVFNVLAASLSQEGPSTKGMHLAHVTVPDARLDFLREMHQPKKCTHASIDYFDLAGLAPAGSGDPTQNAQMLAKAREADALLVVLREFAREDVPHPRGSVEARRDYRDFLSELLLADHAIAEARVTKLEKAIMKPRPDVEKEKREVVMLRRCIEAFEREEGADATGLAQEDERIVRQFQFLTSKPRLILVNVGEDQLGRPEPELPGERVVAMCALMEMELAQLEPAEREPFMQELGITELASEKLIRLCYELLGLVSFFTVGQDEVKAWTIQRGQTALEAAGKVHSDIGRGFIRAETVAFEDLKTLGTMKEVKTHGKLRLEGKDYIVEDGDIINFRFNV